MGIRSSLSLPLAQYVVSQERKWMVDPVAVQKNWLQKLIRKAVNTRFGIDHHFKDIRSHQEFKVAVPLRDYEALRPYIDRVVKGEEDILWPGKPLYFAKTSGTTSGTKYIPISRD